MFSITASRRRTGGVLLALLGALVGSLAAAPAATAYPGAPWFEPSKPYTQNFPDPHVINDNGTYYAYATGTGGAYLPVSRSSDLNTWIARDAYDPGGGLAQKYPGFNDALPYVASWGVHEDTGMHMSSWVMAPGVAKINGRYNAYYSLWASKSPSRHCISVATSSSPQGPFRDQTTQPLQCDDGNSPGDIDPYPFIDPASGTPYLLWASQGHSGVGKTSLFVRQLSPDGLSFAPGSSRVALATTDQAWEGHMIENPAMIRHGGKIFLAYSANDWWTDRYAVGYAECQSPLGPCRKPQGHPLLGNHGEKLGPGGPSLFHDTSGRLRMAYHHWSAPYVGYPSDADCDGGGKCTSQGQRRMSITELRLGGSGLEVGGTRPPVPVLSTDRACPSSVPEDGFVDVAEGAVHEAAIDCVAWWQVAQGSNGHYRPGESVTRGQMASFLARSLLASGESLPAGKNAFNDDAGSVHEDAINRLAAAGIVAGTSSTTFSPDAQVTRGQMATFLARSLRHATGSTPTSSTDWFYDDESSSHQANINAVASAGLVGGDGRGAYSPGSSVSRAQMASFLTRFLETQVRAGARTP